MMEAALKAREAEMEKRSEAEREGATVEGSFHTSYQVWKDVWQREIRIWRNVDGSGRGRFCSGSSPRFEIVDRMRYCPTLGCPAPYFIAQRRSQKYCSDACAVPAQREFKRAWWREHGNHSRRRGTAARQISSRAR